MGRKKVSSCLSSCSDLLPVRRSQIETWSLIRQLYQAMFPFSASFFSPCNSKRSEEKPNIYPTSTHNSIHKHHKVSFTKLQIDNFSKTFRLSCVLCWVAAGARSKAPRNEATETIIFIHNPLRASDLFYEWKISWKSKRGSSVVFKDLFSQGWIFHRKVRTLSLFHSGLVRKCFMGFPFSRTRRSNRHTYRAIHKEKNK